MDMIDAVQAWLPGMAARAEALDRAAAFPAVDMAGLREMGALAAEGEDTVRRLLVLLGRGNLSVARLVEAHLNAIRLVGGAAVAGEGLFGLWVTDAGPPVSAEAGILRGIKSPCSGAGHCDRALVTATVDGGVRMAVIALTGAETVVPVEGMQGMRAAANGSIDLTGVAVRQWVGAPGDYLREPDFSCGAWRASAAAAGAVEALVDAVAASLHRRAQAAAPMQLARFGQLLTARDTALLWVERMAAAAERDGPVDRRVATVNLGRGAVERACLEALQLAQRSLGMTAFVAPEPAERIGRDLATYLRQPAVDAVLLEAAAWHLARA